MNFFQTSCFPFCILQTLLFLLQPEGTRQTVNKAMLIDLRSEPTFSVTINITTPPNIVNGSKDISVTLIGKPDYLFTSAHTSVCWFVQVWVTFCTCIVKFLM